MITNKTGASGTINLTSEENRIRFNYDGTGNFPNTTYEGMFVYDHQVIKAYVAQRKVINILMKMILLVDLSNVNISGVSDGDGLIFSSAQGRFNVKALCLLLVSVLQWQ